MNRNLVLIIIVIAQFAGVSLWFAANAVMKELAEAYKISTSIGIITSLVMLGFVAGTLCYAYLSIADRFSPSKVFFVSSLLAALANIVILFSKDFHFLLIPSRILTGFFIAGIYPVGMKISADYFDKDISRALGFLLGALVVGSAFPNLLRGGYVHMDWQTAIITTSCLSVFGGLLILVFVPDGPYRKRSPAFDPKIIFSIFKNAHLRRAALGYFGHMWELYALWSFIPVAVIYVMKNRTGDAPHSQVMGAAFYIIAIGALGCILGGYIAKRTGSLKVALWALISSGLCCLLSPFALEINNELVFIFLLFWGFTVIADSPQFSSLVSQNAPAENRGAALTIVNCIGFTISIISIQLLDMMNGVVDTRWLFLFLAPGPILGVFALASRPHA